MGKKLSFRSICARDIPMEEDQNRSHNLPIYATSTFIYENPEKAMQVFQGKEDAFIYSRWSNPTVEAVEQKLSSLETFGSDKSARTLLFASGMAAITALLTALTKPGDAILTHGNIYGTTTELLNVVFDQNNIRPVWTSFEQLENIEHSLKKNPKIKVIYIETPNNPTLQCIDISALAKLSRKYNCKLVVDNTFSTSFIQQPLLLGADFVVYSTTKFLNGHGTALGGAVIGGDIDFINQKVWQMRKLMGGNTNAFEAWLLNNGIKTLPLRMEQHCKNSQKIAAFLEKHHSVQKVHYPGLVSHPQHGIATNMMNGYGGVLSFELKKGIKAGIHMMENVKFCTLTATIGTTDTLIQHPASMTHVKVPQHLRAEAGITDGLVRLSVGIEAVNDIIDDLANALEST